MALIVMTTRFIYIENAQKDCIMISRDAFSLLSIHANEHTSSGIKPNTLCKFEAHAGLKPTTLGVQNQCSIN